MENSIAFNCIISEERKKCDYSLSFVSKETRIPRLLVILYERGYLYPNKKHYQALVDFYKLDESVFDDLSTYPVPVKSKKPPIKFDYNKWLYKWWAIASAGAIFLASIAMIIYGSVAISYVDQNCESFYSQEFVTVRHYVMDNGIPLMDADGTSYYAYTYDTTDNKESHNFKAYDASASIFLQSFQVEIDYTTYRLRVEYAPISASNIIGTVYYYLPLSDGSGNILEKYRFDFERTSQTEYEALYVTETLDDGSIKYLDPIDDADEIKEITTKMNATIGDTDARINAAFKSVFSFSSFDVYPYMQDQLKSNGSFFHARDLAVINLTIGSLFGLAVVIFYGFLLINRLQQKYFQSFTETNYEWKLPFADKIKKRPLPKNKRFPLIIPQSVLRLIAVVLLLVGNLGIFIWVYTILYTIAGVDNLLPFEDVYNLVKILKYIIPVGIVTVYFLKLDKILNNQKVMRNMIVFIVAGIFLYVFEIIIVYLLRLEQNALIDLIIPHIPGNIFWGMAVFTSIPLFLFRTPAWAKKSMGRLRLWRSLVIIPIAYLLVSYLIGLGTKLWGIELNDYTRFLISPKSLIIALFALGYIFGSYIYKFIVERKYGVEEAKIYMEGDRFLFYKNIIACALLVILSLLDFLLKDIEYAQTIGFGVNMYIFSVIPLILFYRKHIGKPDVVNDLIYNVGVGIGYTISFILIFFVFIVQVF